jgi:hypothetical protein
MKCRRAAAAAIVPRRTAPNPKPRSGFVEVDPVCGNVPVDWAADSTASARLLGADEVGASVVAPCTSTIGLEPPLLVTVGGANGVVVGDVLVGDVVVGADVVVGIVVDVGGAVVVAVPHVTDSLSCTCCAPSSVQVTSTSTLAVAPNSAAVSEEISRLAPEVLLSTKTSVAAVP